VSITEELLEWKSSGSGSRKPRIRPWRSFALTTRHYPQKLALTSPTSGGRSVGIVRLPTKATEIFSFFMTDTMTSQNIDPSSWDICIRPNHFQKVKHPLLRLRSNSKLVCRPSVNYPQALDAPLIQKLPLTLRSALTNPEDGASLLR
jgi:hypothetical protein